MSRHIFWHPGSQLYYIVNCTSGSHYIILAKGVIMDRHQSTRAFRQSQTHHSRRRQQPGPRLQVGRLRSDLHRARRRLARSIDADGNAYIDYVGSWGPMILGHCHPKVVEADPRGSRQRRLLRRADRAGDRTGGNGLRRLSEYRDGAHGLLRDRSDHERHPPGPRLHRPRQNPQVRRLLPRPRRLPAGQGRLRRRHLRRTRPLPAFPPTLPSTP